MNKPIGYWTSHQPGDNSYLETLQEKYGSRFERMNQREKLYLICAIASHLSCTAYGSLRQELFTVAINICGLPVSDQEGLIEALIHHVRWNPANAELTHNT
ncbi:hypothetical protein [Anabaena sp. CCY 9402-a]|uniref:hypothetical protein n=1 Tax=Anabaena sp. CCY 9402-a TaxID=3103867 RepID=UPI0039C6F035